MGTTRTCDARPANLGAQADERSPETDALIACCRIGASHDDVASALRQVRDWRLLAGLASRHAVAPLVCMAAERAGDGLLPPAADDMRRTSAAIRVRSMRLSAALVNILAYLESQGIPAVAYKGPMLAQYAYGDLTLRSFQDLDLFVARADIPRTCALLEARGFARHVRPQVSDRLAQEEYHAILTGDATVELHWSPGPAYVPPILSAEEALRRARPTDLLGRAVLTLDPADLLLLLATHGHGHHWSQLELVTAFGVVLNRRDYGDPGQVLERARDRRALRRLLLACVLAEELVDADMPAEFRAACGADAPARYLGRRAARFLRNSATTLSRRLPTTVWRSAAMDTPCDSLKLMTLQVFAPREEDVTTTGTSRTPLASSVMRRLHYLQTSMRKH